MFLFLSKGIWMCNVFDAALKHFQGDVSLLVVAPDYWVCLGLRGSCSTLRNASRGSKPEGEVAKNVAGIVLWGGSKPNRGVLKPNPGYFFMAGVALWTISWGVWWATHGIAVDGKIVLCHVLRHKWMCLGTPHGPYVRELFRQRLAAQQHSLLWALSLGVEGEVQRSKACSEVNDLPQETLPCNMCRTNFQVGFH